MSNLATTLAIEPMGDVQFLNIDGIHLEYKLYGNPNCGTPTLVLLHEGLGCIDMWKDFPMQLFETTGYAVFAYSRHGYGRSDPRPPPWPLRYMHDEGLDILPKVLAAVGLDDVVLIGHSDGASIALIYTGGVDRAQTSAIVLMAPHVFVEDISITSIEQAACAYTTTNLRDKLARYHGDNVDGAFWGWNKVWLDAEFASWNIEQYLPGIGIPALLIQGENDQYGTLVQLEAIERQMRGPVRTRVLPDCHHSPHLDQAALTLREIDQFLGAMEHPNKK